MTDISRQTSPRSQFQDDNPHPTFKEWIETTFKWIAMLFKLLCHSHINALKTGNIYRAYSWQQSDNWKTYALETCCTHMKRTQQLQLQQWQLHTFLLLQSSQSPLNSILSGILGILSKNRITLYENMSIYHKHVVSIEINENENMS